jgi:hypothetical protein
MLHQLTPNPPPTPTPNSPPSGERRLLIKYRPVKKAAVHLRALGLVDEDGLPTEERCVWGGRGV